MKLARLSPRAERDLDGIHDFITGDNPEAAARVRATILNTADFLAGIQRWAGSSGMPVPDTRKSVGQWFRGFATISSSTGRSATPSW
jgi:plasmid stabilization system protein ParE